MRYVLRKTVSNIHSQARKGQQVTHMEDMSFLPDLVVDEIPLEETGVLTADGHMICRAPVMGFHTDYI